MHGFDCLAGVGVKVLPFRAHEGECLLLSQGVFLGEGHRLLFADAVEHFGKIVLIYMRPRLVCGLLGEFAKWAGYRRAVAQRRASQRLSALGVWTFFGVQLEGSTLTNAQIPAPLSFYDTHKATACRSSGTLNGTNI